MESFKVRGRTYKAWSAKTCSDKRPHAPHSWTNEAMVYGPYFCNGIEDTATCPCSKPCGHPIDYHHASPHETGLITICVQCYIDRKSPPDSGWVDDWEERCKILEVVAAAMYLGHDDGNEQFDMYRSLYLTRKPKEEKNMMTGIRYANARIANTQKVGTGYPKKGQGATSVTAIASNLSRLRLPMTLFRSNRRISRWLTKRTRFCSLTKYGLNGGMIL